MQYPIKINIDLEKQLLVTNIQQFFKFRACLQHDLGGMNYITYILRQYTQKVTGKYYTCPA